MSDSSTTADQTILALDAPNLPLAIRYPVDADFGVPKDIYDLAGCAVIVQPYLGQQPGDTVSITVNGAPDVDRRQTQSDSDAVTLTIPPQELLSGRFNYLTYSVTRNSQNLGTYEPPLKLLYNSIRPGNQDLTPGDNAHSELVLLLPDEIKNGVGPGFTQATVCVEYPYCRAYDRIRLNCNGRDLDYTVTATQAPPPPSHGLATPTRVCFVVTSADLGDDDPEFSFSFTVNDQLNNTPDEDARWSAVQVVDVDKAGARLPVPIPREDTSDNSDDPSIIDRDKLVAGGPLSLIILTSDSRFRVGDTIEATYTTKVAGQPDVVYIVSGIVAGDFGQTVPCVLQIPNEQIVSGSTAHMAYRLLRDNVLVGTSRTAVATVIGLGEPDEKPVIIGAQDSNGTDIPDGGTTIDTTVTLTGTALKDRQVDIFRNGVRLGTADVNGEGVWTYMAIGLPTGLLSFTAKALYGSGDVSVAWTFTRVEAMTPTIASVKGQQNNDEIPHDTWTLETSVILSGAASAGLEIELFDGTTRIGRFTATDGIWTSSPISVAIGIHNFTARALYGSGQESNIRSFRVIHRLVVETGSVSLDGFFVYFEPRNSTPMPAGTTVTRTPTQGNPPYTYSSSNNDVASVNSAGTVEGVKNGQATITITDAYGQSASYQVTRSNSWKLVRTGAVLGRDVGNWANGQGANNSFNEPPYPDGGTMQALRTYYVVDPDFNRSFFTGRYDHSAPQGWPVVANVYQGTSTTSALDATHAAYCRVPNN